MSFSEIKFMGLTVRGYKSQIGFGRNQLSTLTLDLVQDLVAGDAPAPVPDGFPCFFDFAGYSFYGLLQRFGEKKDIGGFPTFEATLVDPREILEGAEIIIGGYNGTVGLIPNVINAYGWWENNAGFGSSGSTEDTGMPWNKILVAIRNTINNPTGNVYGRPLNFRGVHYGLDLSELPTVPSYYTIGSGSNIGLLEAIAQICEDCGCDFYIYLDGFNIRVKVVSRLVQPPLGTITSLVNSGFGNTLIRSDSATEVRNELTSSFLIGGAVTALFETDTSSTFSFWGYDSFSNPIFGAFDTFNIKNSEGKIIHSLTCEFMGLNARGIEDIIGTDTYACSTLEMLFAKYSHDAWTTFIKSQRPDIAKFLMSPFLPIVGLLNGQKPLKNQIVNDGKDQAIAWAQAQVNSTIGLNDARLYEFVKNYADEFMGKKFVVQIPFVLTRQDALTSQITYSQEITDAGWTPEGTLPLGLSEINEDVFQNNDGRYTAFCRFFVDPLIQPIDFSAVSAADSVLELENSNLFLKCSVDPRVIIVPDGTPYALVTLPSAVHQEAVDSIGGFAIVLAVLGIDGANQENALNILKKSFVPIRLYPNFIYPDAFGIPLKSNIQTYGPWFVAGAPGKTRVEQDSGLTPWNYGGEAALQLAATSRVATSVTNMQISEAGSMELAGLPTVSLGDVLAADGPNLTNVGVSYGVNGITTTYRFETFTPKWHNVLSRGVADRIRKASTAAQGMRKSIRQSLRSSVVQAQASAGRQAQAGFLANASKILKRESPHDTFVSWSGQDENGLTRTILSTVSYEEAVSLANADNDGEFQNTAIMSLNGIVRPFSTSMFPLTSGNLIPRFAQPSGFANAINVNSYNPFDSKHDVEVFAFGSTYSGLNQRDRNADYTNSRGFALRGPLIVNGFGYDINLNPVPNNGSGDPTSFLDDVLLHSESWKTGPVDLLWDNELGIYTCHGTMTGRATADILPGWNGQFNIQDNLLGSGTLSGRNLQAVNFQPSTIPSGSPSLLHYSYKAGQWLAVMPGGSGGAVATVTESILRGVTTASILANSSGNVNLTDSPFGTKNALNIFSSAVGAGKNVIIGYINRVNQWGILSSDC